MIIVQPAEKELDDGYLKSNVSNKRSNGAQSWHELWNVKARGSFMGVQKCVGLK
jgi:hypothetical protein